MTCAEQIIEYEDFDNATDGYQVNEYEYEEEDERYGPAEREREFSLNAAVRAELQTHAVELFRVSSSSAFIIRVCVCLSALTQNMPEKGEKGEPGYFGPVRKNTDTQPLRVCDPRCVAAALQTC